MLIQCPECQLQVSDKATSCPHCGYPMKADSNLEKKYKRKSFHRLPNGFGQISEIKGTNLRKPFRAMVSIGKDENGRPIQKMLRPEAYFATYKEAYEALLKYNNNPETSNQLTIQDLYDRWSKEKYKTLSEGRIKAQESAWKYCGYLKALAVSEIRVNDIRTGIEQAKRTDSKGNIIKPTPTVQKNILTILAQMFDYAVAYEITDRNPVRSYTKALLDKKPENKPHICFTEDELNILWEHADDTIVAMVLIQCYSGWRPGELCVMKTSDVNINDWTFTGGLKTDAGRNRVVPIHTRIRPLVLGLLNNSEYLTDMSYRVYYSRFLSTMARYRLNPNHKPHDPRKTFVTRAKQAEVDEYAIKYLVGHAIHDITEKVYTDRNINWLRSELEKIR